MVVGRASYPPSRRTIICRRCIGDRRKYSESIMNPQRKWTLRCSSDHTSRSLLGTRPSPVPPRGCIRDLGLPCRLPSFKVGPMPSYRQLSSVSILLPRIPCRRWTCSIRRYRRCPRGGRASRRSRVTDGARRSLIWRMMRRVFGGGRRTWRESFDGGFGFLDDDNTFQVLRHTTLLHT